MSHLAIASPYRCPVFPSPFVRMVMAFDRVDSAHGTGTWYCPGGYVNLERVLEVVYLYLSGDRD